MTPAHASRCEVEISPDGHLRIAAADAARFFPGDALLAAVAGDEIVLLPARGGGGGGLILKQRNASGDKSVLIAEALGFRRVSGRFTAVWDDGRGGLRVPLAAAAIPRPQPVGVFPFPRSHLLAPPGDDAARAAAVLGDEDAARTLLPATVADVRGDTPLARHNAFVLAPSAAALAAIEAEGDAAFTALARAAAFAHGLVDDLPDPGPLDGELKSVVQMTAAAGRFEQGDARAARSLLVEAAASAEAPAPVFAAMLEMQIAESLPPEAADLALEHLRRAERLAEQARLPRLRAAIWLRQGAVHQQLGADGSRGPLVEAVNCYQKAIAAGIGPENDPVLFGQLQNNLGLAYLCMPTREASDRLRTGIAVQSFRKALDVQDRGRDPDMWASVTMNLASALQYLPSTHPADNLAEAVEHYEEVLAVRTEARDPVIHARVLLNQANALSHLGIFKPAIEKLAKAMKLFSWHDHADEAAAAKDLLDGIQAWRDESRDADGVSPEAAADVSGPRPR
jgi:tetratricopeptide (TPR) repeat protein